MVPRGLNRWILNRWIEPGVEDIKNRVSEKAEVEDPLKAGRKPL